MEGDPLSVPPSGRWDAPGRRLSPGEEHSSKAEIAPQQLTELSGHSIQPPFKKYLSTY